MSGELPSLASDEELAAARHARRPIHQTEWSVADDAAAAEELRACLETIQAEQYYLTLQVGILREAGWSWQRVGDAFGFTRQAAMKSYRDAARTLRLAHEAATMPGGEGQARELERIYKRLTIGEHRVEFQVIAESGELVSRHYVEGRADLAADRHKRETGEPARVVQVSRRSRGGGVSSKCRGCRLDHCRCREECERCGRAIVGEPEPECRAGTCGEPVAEEEPF